MALSKQLDLFSERAIQNDLFGGEYITVRPYNNISNGPIDFIIKDSKDYFDLKESVLCVKLKVVAADGTPIKEAGKDDVALINNAMHSIFSDVQVFLNQKRVDGGDTLYGFRSYINTMLSYSTETQKNQLFAFGFVKDDYNAMDAKTNTAFIARKAWTANGALKTFCGKLNCALFQQDRLLIPGVDLHVKLERAKDAFALFNFVETIKPKIVIEEAILHLLKVKVSPAIMQHHAMTLARNVPAIYELNRVEIDTIPVKKESLGVVREDIFYGKIPKYVVMLMVSNAAYYGDYTLNPYNFKHYNVKMVELTRDGEPTPFEMFEPNFKTGDCLREYMSLYQSNDLMGKDAILPISYEEFKNGFTNFQWNMSDNLKGLNAISNQRGNLKLELKFDGALSESIMVIMYGIFDSNVLVYGSDMVLVDGQ